MKKIITVGFLAVFAVTMVACGSGSGGVSGLNGATSVTGTVYSSSGDPMSGATIYLPGVTVSTSVSTKSKRVLTKTTTSADGTTTCDDPPAADSSLAAVCTGANGQFTLNTSSVTTNPEQIVFKKGTLKMVQSLDCSGTSCALGSTTTTFGSSTTTWPTIAVVTGNWDSMESVLAKLADSNTADDVNGSYGRVDMTTGIFVYGSEYGTNLTIIDGTGGTAPAENADKITYKTWDKYLDGTEALVSGGSPVFEIIFINCGNNYESQLSDTNVRSRLQAYITAGGKLYVTDLSYDFIEQPFPQVMKFKNDPDSTTTAGTIGAAEVGTAGITLNANVNTTMVTWLGSVTVNQHDANTPGNPDVDCSGSVTCTTRTGALTSGNLIPLGDFLSGWAEMDSRHTGDTTTTIWIDSGTTSVGGMASRPLTISREMNSSGGRIIYSSYHTALSHPTLTFWPQERVLQYLIFEAF